MTAEHVFLDAPNAAQATGGASVLVHLDADLRQKAVQAAADLRANGWAVVEGVLPGYVPALAHAWMSGCANDVSLSVLHRSECDAYLDGLWNWLESLGTGISRDDPGTWQAPVWPANFRGIINTLAVSHQPFVWRLRKSDRVRQVR